MATITFREPVYTYHIDFNRHVSNIVYIQWMEIGRLKLLEAIGYPVHATDTAGFVPVLVETQIRYRKPLYLGESVDVEVWLSALQHLSAWMEFRFTRTGELVAEGRQRGVFVETATHQPKRLTDAERSAFLPYLIKDSERL